MKNQEFENLNTRQLLALWARTLRELLDRRIVRTLNNPIGDIAEAIVAEHFDGTRATFNNPGWDVATPDGQKIEVKSLRLTGIKPRTNLSPIPRNSEFTSLVIVVFDEELRVMESLLVPREVVLSVFKPRARDGATIVRVTDALRDDPRVTKLDISDDILDV